jgi:hypothetical protein
VIYALLQCDSCEESVRVDLDRDGVISGATHAEFCLDTPFIDAPEGWLVGDDARVACPEHA